MVHDISPLGINCPNAVEQYVQAHNSTEEPAVPSRLDRAKYLTNKVKATAHRLLEDDTSIQSEIDNNDLFEDAAYNPQKILQDSPVRTGSVRGRLHRGIKAVADVAKNPRRAITNSYTRKAAVKVSRRHHDGAADFNEVLLKAEDDLNSAKASASPIPEDNDCHRVGPGVDDAQERLDRIMEQRESLRSAWILGRHVKRVKIVQPLTSPPSRVEFQEVTVPGKQPQTRWLPYIGHLVLWHTRSFTAHHIDDYDNPPFDLTELANTVERLAVISTPWQTWLMEVREVYMWTEPKRTLRWMIVFWVLWYFQYILPFIVGWVIYSTISNKLHPTDLKTIRESVERAQDHTTRAQAWSELIQRHGKQDWVEPLIDVAGPIVQLQLGDIANYLEILQNFYRWERPRKTLATLFYFVCCFFFITFTSMEFCVKIVWLKIGCMFFFGFPIATHYPRYRHIVNPYYWMYWDIPNTAELAIIQLQEKAVIKDAEEMDSAVSETDPMETLDTISELRSDTSSDLDYHDSHTSPMILDSNITAETKILATIRSRQSLTFRAVLLSNHTHSRLTLTRTGFWLYNKTQKQFHPFTTLVEVQKVDLNSNSDNNYSKNPRSSMAQFKETLKKLTTLQYIPSGLSFIFLPDTPTITTQPDSQDMTEQEDRQCATNRDELTLIVSEVDRDKIFSVVLSWSNLKWQPMYSMDRQNMMGSRDGQVGGNRNLDDAIKKAVKSL